MKVLEKFGIETSHESLYEKAFTHTSYANEHDKESYERLEYLGDAVLELIMSEYLYKKTDYEEGTMTKLRSSYVCEDALYEYSLKLGLNEYLRLGHGEKEHGGKYRKAIVADIFEAFIGAMYLDKGLEFTSNYLNEKIIKYINNNYEFFHDYKTKLQELVQTDKKSLEYVIIREEGPAHDRTFEVEVRIDGILYGTGIGNSKKKAEQEAAREALEKSAKNA